MSNKRTGPVAGDEQTGPLPTAQLEAALADARVRRAKALALKARPNDPIPSQPWDGSQDLSVPLIDEFNLDAALPIQAAPRPEPRLDETPPEPEPVREPEPEPEPEVVHQDPDPVWEPEPVLDGIAFSTDPLPGDQRITIWLPEHEMEAEDLQDDDADDTNDIFFAPKRPTAAALEEQDEALWEELNEADYRHALKKLPEIVPAVARRLWGRPERGLWRTAKDRRDLQSRRAALISGVASFVLVVGIGWLVPFGRPPAPESVQAVPPPELQKAFAIASQANVSLPQRDQPIMTTPKKTPLVVADAVRPELPMLDDAVGALATDDALAQAVADAVSQALAEPEVAPLAEAGPTAGAEALPPELGVAVSPRPMPRPDADQARVVIPSTADGPSIRFAEGIVVWGLSD